MDKCPAKIAYQNSLMGKVIEKWNIALFEKCEDGHTLDVEKNKAMKISTAFALAELTKSTKPFIELFTHGTLSVEIYKPDRVDLQQPHDRDEVYVIMAGFGEFICGKERSKFAQGDFLFVPAGVEHRFVDFSDDFSTWVIFYGPKGGEASN